MKHDDFFDSAAYKQAIKHYGYEYIKQNFDELRLSNDSVQQIDKQIKALKEKSKVEIGGDDTVISGTV